MTYEYTPEARPIIDEWLEGAPGEDARALKHQTKLLIESLERQHEADVKALAEKDSELAMVSDSLSLWCKFRHQVMRGSVFAGAAVALHEARRLVAEKDKEIASHPVHEACPKCLATKRWLQKQLAEKDKEIADATNTLSAYYTDFIYKQSNQHAAEIDRLDKEVTALKAQLVSAGATPVIRGTSRWP